MVCKLQRSIYGLKQASQSWNIRFDQAIKTFGFDKNLDDPSVYKTIQGVTSIFLVLYVDDILLIGNDIEVLSDVKDCLELKFYETRRISYWHYLKLHILIKFLLDSTWRILRGELYPLDMKFIFPMSNHEKLLKGKNA